MPGSILCSVSTSALVRICRIGRPSDERFPAFESWSFIWEITSILGANMRLCIFFTLPAGPDEKKLATSLVSMKCAPVLLPLTLYNPVLSTSTSFSLRSLYHNGWVKSPVPISGGDAHSLPKLGREATVFAMEKPSYKEIISQIKEKRFKMNIEFYPEEGKYHFDGHRQCGISLSPEEAKKFGNLCPKCRKPLTIGVLHRVEQLADREEGYRPSNAIPFVHAIPLQEIIAYVTKKGDGTAYVKEIYDKLINAFGNEFAVLLEGDVGKISEIDSGLGKAIENVRNEHVKIVPGYDGVFGIIDILNQMKVERNQKHQSRINDF